MFDELLRLYQNNGVLKENNQRLDDLLLHQACPDCQACWADREEGQNDWNRVQMPYIGPLYSSSPVRLVAIGLNLHGHGGLFSVHKHLVQVQFLLKAKHTRMHFGAEGYGATMTFHRLAAYCLMATRTDWEVRDSQLWLGESPLLQDWDALAGGLNSVAFLNAVKCSPDWERSTPTDQMRQRCPLRFLQHELHILQPKALLVLGTDNFDHLRLRPCGESTKSEDSSSRVLRCTLPNGITVPVANVTHPAYPRGGCAQKVAVNLGRLLKDTNWPALQLKRSLQRWERLTPEQQERVAREAGECLELDRQVKEKGIRKVLEEQEEQEKRERQNKTR